MADPVEPITLADAKRQLSVTGSADDQIIADAIADARGWIENYTGLILTRRTVTEIIPCFTSSLRAWPIVSIDSIAYIDADQGETIVPEEKYFAQIARRPARLSAANWPAIYRGSVVEVTMTAGFATPDAIASFSPNILRATRILAAGYYLDREGGDMFTKAEDAAKSLCRNFRRWTI